MIAWLAPLAAVAAQASEPVYAKSGSIGLIPPANMREASGFAGFEDIATNASITLAELPAEAYAEVVDRLDAGGTLPNGVTVEREGAAITLADGTPAKLYRGAQGARGVDYVKWVLLADGKSITAIVTAQVPREHQAKIGPAVEAALRSVTLRGSVGIDAEIAALPFTIGDRADFRAVRTLMGSAVVFTDGPLDIDPDNSQPFVIVAGSMGATPIADRAGTARAAFERFGGMEEVKVESEATDGDSHRIAGTATNRGKSLTLVQHMRFAATGGYIRTMCVAPAAIDIGARCDRLAASVAVKAAD